MRSIVPIVLSTLALALAVAALVVALTRTVHVSIDPGCGGQVDPWCVSP